MNFKSELNQKQYEAASTNKQYVRVIAGAGTGKTRVLTYRIAYLLSELNVEPWGILAITFTNKAAKEMLERVVRFFPDLRNNLWISTFHSFCNRFLRSEIKVLNFNANFHILDEHDQEVLIKRIMTDRGFRKSDEETKLALRFIFDNRNEGRLPSEAKKQGFPLQHHELLVSVYEEYEVSKQRSNALDFDDLILKTLQILTNYPEVRQKWSRRFRHILVDEFQDTNDTQYQLIRLLMNSSTNLYVVGDPDQTIYTWRGAKQEIIVNLKKEFLDLETIILDKNYRSTQTILDKANKLIALNKNRIHKDLEAVNAQGVPVQTHSEQYASQEAGYICRRVKEFVKAGYKYNDMAVLYRSNYVSLNLEKQFMRYGIPYVIYGNVKFYQREEIKDILAYFNLVDNPYDDLSFVRIANTPRRALGDKGIEQLTTFARQHELACTQYIQSKFIEDEMKPRQVELLREMLSHIEKLQDGLQAFYASKQEIDDLDDLKDAFEDFILRLQFKDYLEKTKENAPDRIENVDSLIGDVIQFMSRDFNNTFSEYLQNISLISHQDEIDNSNSVRIMTVHIAKGLEFPIVFIYSFNEGVFPARRSVEEGGSLALEEERRLAYVAFTRAKEKLIITYNTDYNFSIGASGTPSSFLAESGFETMEKEAETQKAFREFYGKQNRQKEKEQEEKILAARQPSNISNGLVWAEGERLVHRTFGPGCVAAVLANGIIEVQFDSGERKKLMGAHFAISREA